MIRSPSQSDRQRIVCRDPVIAYEVITIEGLKLDLIAFIKHQLITIDWIGIIIIVGIRRIPGTRTITDIPT
ncbi:hypothetical protein MSNKSG1_09418 [Marinobacter santoriniensis NKSG1]|uniref:Uncharacterized protein n=1 Tax=Marinobacter santoriniensis NKSG1 TaxID=1288826 RepID=M7CR04_9GAMM|nr:hypothetical protein MSNKSG1_09418 [Marinobacter santoriniensis NKSG1]